MANCLILKRRFFVFSSNFLTVARKNTTLAFPMVPVGLFRMLNQNHVQNVSFINLFYAPNPSLIRSDRKTIQSSCNL